MLFYFLKMFQNLLNWFQILLENSVCIVLLALALYRLFQIQETCHLIFSIFYKPKYSYNPQYIHILCP